jgi:hypothetical protein
MKKRQNSFLWIGFGLTLVALAGYPLVFMKFAVTNDVPWPTYSLFVVALGFLVAGLRRAYAPDSEYRGRILASVLTFVSVAGMAFFLFAILVFSRQLPASHGTPQIGQRAPDFTLHDMNGRSVSLPALLQSHPAGAAPTRGVLLVFYRGYW